MSNEKAQLVVDGDVSPLRQKLREAGNDLKRFGTEGRSSVAGIGSALGALQSKFLAIGAILAGGAVFREAVAQTAELTEESMKLGRAMDMTAGEASVLREALTAGNTSQEEFVGAAKGLAKQLRTNEDGLLAMGLKTRDAAGQLRPLNELVLEGIGVLNGYRAGTDRAIAGQVMFGKGFEMTSNLALMNKKNVKEVEDQMRALGMVVGVENVKDWEAFDNAGDKATLTLKGINTAIGSALLPVLTDLGNWFSNVGPGTVTVIRGALGGLVSVFHLITTGVVVLAETIRALLISVVEPLVGLSSAIGLALTGNFAAAGQRLKGISTNINNVWSGAMDRMAEKSQSTRDRIWNLFAQGTPTAEPGKGGKSAVGLLDPAKEKKESDPSFMGTYDARLAEIKNAYEQEHALRQFSKEQELAYWRELLQTYDVTLKDRVAIVKRAATLELEIRRQTAKEALALDGVGIDAQRAAAMAQVQSDAQAAQFALASGTITKAQLLALEAEFAGRRYEIEYQALLQRMDLAKNDPTTSPAALAQINEQMLDVERQYIARRGEVALEIRRQTAQQALQISLLQAQGGLDAEMARIAELEATSQHEVEIGRATQANHLANVAAFNAQRLAAEQSYLEQKRQLALQDPEQNPVELERIELEKAEIRRRYAGQASDVQRQQVLESRSLWRSWVDSITGLWDKGVQALMNGTLTWSNAVRAIGAQMTQWFVTNVVGKMVKEWLAGEAAKIAGKLGFTALEKSLTASSTVATIGAKGAETTAVASMNAVQAGTGAAASQASIPFVGPLLALAAMAAVFAAVSAMGSRKSAMRGYDIPRGLNPMTQLHEEEMVLPKALANAVRNMTAGGESQSGNAAAGGGQINLYVSAVDGRSVKRLFMENGPALAASIRKQASHFAFKQPPQ